MQGCFCFFLIYFIYFLFILWTSQFSAHFLSLLVFFGFYTPLIFFPFKDTFILSIFECFAHCFTFFFRCVREFRYWKIFILTFRLSFFFSFVSLSFHVFDSTYLNHFHTEPRFCGDLNPLFERAILGQYWQWLMAIIETFPTFFIFFYFLPFSEFVHFLEFLIRSSWILLLSRFWVKYIWLVKNDESFSTVTVLKNSPKSLFNFASSLSILPYSFILFQLYWTSKQKILHCFFLTHQKKYNEIRFKI